MVMEVNMKETVVKETFAVMTKSGSNISGYGTLSRARKFQKSWLEDGYPSGRLSNYGWTHNGLCHGGRIEDLTDTHIVKRTEIIIEQVVTGSVKSRTSK